VSAPSARAYYRMSDDRQENSIERQQAQVETFAEKNGYTISVSTPNWASLGARSPSARIFSGCRASAARQFRGHPAALSVSVDSNRRLSG
jgi:hypothetical protein